MLLKIDLCLKLQIENVTTQSVSNDRDNRFAILSTYNRNIENFPHFDTSPESKTPSNI